MKNGKQLSMCLICGRPLFAHEQLIFEDSRVLRHANCSKDSLLPALRKQAEVLGLTPLDLLTRRLAELQQRIIQALGDVSLEQFHNPEPAGHVLLQLPCSDLKVRVMSSPYIRSEAIYHEALLPPGELQEQKVRLLTRIKGKTLSAPGSAQSQSAEYLMAGHLKNGDEHWNGRKKEDIALEILATERIALRILASAEMDRELVSRSFDANPSKLEAIAQQILSALDEEANGQLTGAKREPAEVI